MGHDPGPAEILQTVQAAVWVGPRLHRSGHVDWAMRQDLQWAYKLFGGTPRFAVVAGR